MIIGGKGEVRGIRLKGKERGQGMRLILTRILTLKFTLANAFSQWAPSSQNTA
jgi:hypothetical protein